MNGRREGVKEGGRGGKARVKGETGRWRKRVKVKAARGTGTGGKVEVVGDGWCWCGANGGRGRGWRVGYAMQCGMSLKSCLD